MVLMVTGCSSRKLAYQFAPTLIVSWLDRALDLSSSQKEQLRPRLRALLSWHRREELPLYTIQIAELRRRLRGDFSADDQRWLWARTGELGDRLVNRVAPVAAELLASLTPEQIVRAEKLTADDRKELARQRALPVDKWIADRTNRDAKALERWVGPVLAAQRVMLSEHRRRTRDDHFARWQEQSGASATLVERLRQRPPASAIASELRRLFDERREGSSPEHAALVERMRHEADRFTMALYRTATPAQRQHLDHQIGSYEDDFITLAAGD